MRGFRSLRWRLTALIGAVVVLSVGATYFAVYRGVGGQLRDQIDRELRADADAFGRAGVPAGRLPIPRQPRTSARRYIASQPFRASSRLLIVTLPGRPPLSNEPELDFRRRPGWHSRPRRLLERPGERRGLAAALPDARDPFGP